jgi:hypothetical protein
MDQNFKRRYQEKAKDSFKTKLNLYLFSNAISHNWVNVNLDNFKVFKIDSDLVTLYTTKYWQLTSDHELVNGLTNDAIYKEIAIRKKQFKSLIELFRTDYIENDFAHLFPLTDFEKLLAVEQCAYCQITIEEINRLGDAGQLRKKNYRGWTLEIDRRDSNLEYKPDNCVMACYWCNNAKTDEFTYEEFVHIGNEIKAIWRKRMGTSS